MIIHFILVYIIPRIIFIFLLSWPFEVNFPCDYIPSGHLIITIEGNKFIINNSGSQVEVSFLHTHKKDWISMEDR